MPRRIRSRCFSDPVTTTVKCADPITGKSLSFTVYGAEYEEVARRANADLGHYFATPPTWKTTATNGVKRTSEGAGTVPAPESLLGGCPARASGKRRMTTSNGEPGDVTV